MGPRLADAEVIAKIEARRLDPPGVYEPEPVECGYFDYDQKFDAMREREHGF